MPFSITTHGAAAALVTEDGTLALPVLDYEFDYPAEIRTAYAAIKPDFHDTFSPSLSLGLNLGAQLHFLKTVFPADFARTHFIFTYRNMGLAPDRRCATEVTRLAATQIYGCQRKPLSHPRRQAEYSREISAASLRLRCTGPRSS
ncbi:hypothetical protein [Brucella inopinata]|uniref:hypothetical protein n=1 Tax=Brucella inopinata TaxID=1218315 RepID=UPI001FDFC9D5|nr:hypothetical protein [Brucella inopinata]